MRADPQTLHLRPGRDQGQGQGPARQRGGFLGGLLLGLLLGVGVALGVAVYVSKVPLPFVDKLPQRTPEQDAAEATRNRNWDPNAPLSGKTPLPPGRAASAAEGAEGGASAPAGATATGAATTAAPGATPDGGRSTPPRTPDARAEVTGLFVQVGAFSRLEDAEAQRAKVAMLGLNPRISEREQNGRPVFRVRVGPYESREEAAGPMERLQSNGLEVSLVRVERSAAP